MKPLRPRALALAGLVLAGCGPAPVDLDAWMAEQRRTIQPKVVVVEPPKPYHPEPYRPAEQPEPFSPAKFVSSGLPGAQPRSPLLEAELRRRRDPLEAYPLDAIVLVGTMERGGERHALLRVDRLLHRARVGEYLGQNHGRIIRLGERELLLREIVQDASGEWIERPVSLQLQESSR